MVTLTNELGLSPEEIRRYSRHLLIPEVGLEGQKKLKASSVLVIGTGGLGSPVSMYLAAAGVGRIGLVDYDVVDFSNLQRQIVHGTARLNDRKVDSARDRLLDLNPDIEVEVYNELFNSENAFDIAEGYDIIIDGTDNFPTRYLVNDVSVMLGIPNVYGSIFRFRWPGQRLRWAGWAVLSLLVPRTAAAGFSALLCRGWCAGRFAGHDRYFAGHRSHQATAWISAQRLRAVCCSTTRWIPALSMSSCVRTRTAKCAAQPRRSLN